MTTLLTEPAFRFCGKHRKVLAFLLQREVAAVLEESVAVTGRPVFSCRGNVAAEPSAEHWIMERD